MLSSLTGDLMLMIVWRCMEQLWIYLRTQVVMINYQQMMLKLLANLQMYESIWNLLLVLFANVFIFYLLLECSQKSWLKRKLMEKLC